MDPNLIDHIPFMKNRERSAIIISYIDSPPDDKDKRKRKAIDRMVTIHFVSTIIFTASISLMAGIFFASIVAYTIGSEIYLDPSENGWRYLGLALAGAFWLRLAPPIFGERLKELINRIEWYAAEDGYYGSGEGPSHPDRVNSDASK